MKFLIVILFTLFSSILGGDVLIEPTLFNEMLKHRNDEVCQDKGFYTYDAFMNAARFLDAFGTTGNDSTRKREFAAFFGQTSDKTTGGWESAPDGPFAWGYCFITEGRQSGPGFSGREPIQLTSEYNYEQAGIAIGEDLVNNPDLVATDPSISFIAAIWFWMTPQWKKPSSHDVITGKWSPSVEDQSPAMVSSPTLSTAGLSAAKVVPMIWTLIGSGSIRGIVSFLAWNMGPIWTAKIKSILAKIANYLSPNKELWTTTNYNNKQAILCNYFSFKGEISEVKP